MFRKVAVLAALFLLIPLTIVAEHIPCEVTKFTASDASEDALFGWSVSIDDDYVTIGAGCDNFCSGSAYIFHRDGTFWSEEAKLTASDGASGDIFGCSVSIRGDYAIVGAYGDSDSGSYTGSAYILHRSGTIWSEEAKLTASDGAELDYFGHGVSISGDFAVVGAHRDDDAGSNAGSAYIFLRDGTTWSEEVKLTASDGAEEGFFGASVSISGDYCGIGASGDNNAGAAYIFKREGTTWIEETKLTASDGAEGDWFGYVSIEGDRIVIGAPGQDDMRGSAYVFRRDGTTWTEEAKLTASDGAVGDLFGLGVSISGDYCVIGAGDDDNAGDNSGSAYIFRRNGTTWTEEAKLTASDEAEADEFGWGSVAISGEYALIPATGNDDGGDRSGSAYIFGLDHTTCGTVAADLTCVPPAGTVPFSVNFTTGVTNNYIGQIRRIACHLDVQLAGGSWYPNWRVGSTNVGAGQTHLSSWIQMIPAIGAMIGPNTFSLVAEDVTPSPYNQPPYPPAGDNDTAICTVTGIAP